ncbi:MAG: dynein light chain Tctex-type family protein [archaeon]|nr:dynein light chain Tctex-type family protein [archaeon]
MEQIQIYLDKKLENKLFDESKADQLINDILEDVMEILYSFKKPYKYIMDLMVSHRVGANMTNTTSASWDKDMDNIYYIYFPKEKGASGKEKPLIFALLTIFIVSYVKK